MLDNYEHVLTSAPLLSELLQASSELCMLITSREVLHLYGEHEYTVSPLKLPDNNQPTALEELSQFDAIQLFSQRAKSVSRNFQLNDNNMTTIAQICTRLDGLPLAIELAATRIKLLTPDALLNRLDTRLDILSSGARDLPDRQQTIRKTIEWSYDLLDEQEKRMFARLAVFRGGRCIEACEAVCSVGLKIDVLDGLASLIDKNLLVQGEDSLGDPRFWMLETIQEFALECLVKQGDSDVIQELHAIYFMQLAERAAPELLKAQQVRWIEQIEIEHNNIRSALRWALDGADPELGVRLVVALGEFWYMRMYHLEAENWINTALEFADEVGLSYSGRLFAIAGYFRWRLHRDHLACRLYCERAYKIGQEINDKWLVAYALRYMAGSVIGRPQELADRLQLDEAYQFAQQSIALWTELGELAELAHSMNALASLLDFNGKSAEAKQVYEECLKIARTAKDIRRIGGVLVNLASIERKFENHPQALFYARESLKIAQEVKDLPTVVASMINIENPIHKPLRTTRLLSASYTIMENIALIRVPTVENTFQASITTVKQQLDAEAFAKAWEAGRKLSLEEAVAYALDECDEF